MRHIASSLITLAFLVAGLLCWTILPKYDVAPFSDAAREWAIAGNILVALSVWFAYLTITIKEVVNNTTYNLHADGAPPGVDTGRMSRSDPTAPTDS